MNVCPQSNMMLVGDDDPDDRLLVGEAMAEMHPLVPLRFARDGAELMDYLYRRGPFADAAQHPTPGLILLDLNMPKKSGREALREIRSDPGLRGIPVVIWTTSCTAEDTDASRRDGATRFITKPNNYRGIQNALREIVGAFLPGNA